MIPFSSTWVITSRTPVSDDPWAQIEICNQCVYGFNLPAARLVGTDAWYGVSFADSVGDVLRNTDGYCFKDTFTTYRALGAEYIMLTSDRGDTTVRISIKGRIARTKLFGKTVELL